MILPTRRRFLKAGVWLILPAAILVAGGPPFFYHPPSSIAARRTLGRFYVRHLEEFSAIDPADGARYVNRLDGVVFSGDAPLICPHCGLAYRWKTKPYSGERIRIPATPGKQLFFICCPEADVFGRRIFLFAEPAEDSPGHARVLLRFDSEMDWTSQCLKTATTRP